MIINLPSKSFYASSDGWVCYGIPGISGSAMGVGRLEGRIFKSATASADAMALNAIAASNLTDKAATALVASFLRNRQ
jgi:hypothetical protein